MKSTEVKCRLEQSESEVEHNKTPLGSVVYKVDNCQVRHRHLLFRKQKCISNKVIL